MRKKITLFCAFLLIGISLAIAQAVQVTGVVVSSEDDLPVVGASILVKGTSNGTITDIDGKFTLKVNKGAKLVISYIGMKSQTVTARYGAQNETYMSRSAEKWVKGLCFNELGVGG